MKLKLYFTALFTFFVISTNIYASDTTEEPEETILFSPPIIHNGPDIGGNFFTYKPDNTTLFYVLEENKIYYKDSINGRYLTKILLEDADIKNFKDLGRKYGKDRKNVYYQGYKIEGKVDVGSFEVLTIKRENLSINPQFAKDKYHIFIKGKLIDKSDSKTFKKIQHGFYADKNNIYDRDGQILEDSDSQNYKFVGLNHIVSNNHVYFSNHLFVEVMDPGSFEVVEGGCGYYKDKYQLYSSSKVLSGADVNSYKILYDCNYLKSNKNIYHCGELIEGADANSFEIINSGISLSKDKNYVYDWSVRKEGIDPKTLRAVDSRYYCESNNLYFYSDFVCWVDGKSFFNFNDSYRLFKDDYKLYYIANGSLLSLIEVDGKSIRQLSDNWFVDKDRAYYLEYSYEDEFGIFHKIDKIDAATFEVLDDNTVKDKNGVYNIKEIQCIQ